MSRKLKAQKREIHEAIAEGQAIMAVNDTWFLHEAKRQRMNLVRLKERQIVEGTEPSYCGDIDGLSLYFMQADTDSLRRQATR